MINFQRDIIVIAGPTASGKSDIALRLAKEINGEIINGDSRQIYKELSIGTAKPTEEEMGDIPHHLYGHVSVKDQYNIFRYQSDVQEVLDSLAEDVVPIIVGGTGLYIDSVVFNYKLDDHTSSEYSREYLNTLELEELQNMVDADILKDLNSSDRNNPVRLVRILEKGNRKQESGEVLNHKYFVIDLEKDQLDRRIEIRTEKMFENGLIEENIALREEGLHKYIPAKTIGYQEFDDYFEKEIPLDEVKKNIITNTKRYAKRQKTWFRRNENAIWTNRYEDILEESLKVKSIS